MAYEGWLTRASAPIITAAAATPGLTQDDTTKLTGLAWLAATHKRLIHLNDADAQAAYDKLDKKAQAGLLEVFGHQKYSPEHLGFFGTVMNYFGEAMSNIGSTLTGYGEAIGQPVRAMAIAKNYQSFADAWNAASDGNRVFDADKEKNLRSIYGDTVADIAKKFAEGKQLSDVILAAKTDEEFNIIGRMLKGDQVMQNAVRDFGDAKISLGRIIANGIGLNPDAGVTDQGVEGKMYKMLSGTIDAAYDIAADPTTWLFLPASALNKSAFAISEILRAETAMQHGIGSLSTVQKFTKAFGRTPGIAGAFENKTVRSLFDRVGEQVKIAAESTSRTEVAKARAAIQDIHPMFDNNFIDEMIRGKAYNADAALTHFSNTENLMNIVQGKVGTDSLILPSRGHVLYVRNRLSQLSRKISGYDKSAIQMDRFIKDGTIDSIAAAETPKDASAFRELRVRQQTLLRGFDRALVNKTIYTGGEIAGKNARNKSADSIYAIARATFDKPTAKLLTQMFVSAPSEADARNIVKGLFQTVGEAMGATRTAAGRKDMETLLAKMTSAQFTEEKAVYGDVARMFGVEDGTLVDASRVVSGDGTKQSLAPAEYNLSHMQFIPQLVDIYRIQVKHANGMRTYMSGIGDRARAVTDFWSAMNLLPRLGLRSVLDEALFNFLTVPVHVARNVFRGYQASYTERMILGKEGFKDVGVVARHILRPVLLKNVTEDEIKKAMGSQHYAARLIERQLTTSLLGRVNFAGKNGKLFASYIRDMVQYGGHEQVRALSEGANKMVSMSRVAGEEQIAKVMDINDGLRKASRKHGVEFTGHPTIWSKSNNTPIEYQLNAMAQILNRVDRNGIIGQLAVKNIHDPETAVAEIADALRKDPALHARFDSSTINTPEQDALRFFTHVHNVLTDDAGKINDLLLSKITKVDKKGVVTYSGRDLTLEDMDEVAHMLPSKLFGYANSVPIYENFGSYMNAMIDSGFRVSDRQLATLSRSPVTYMYAMSLRHQYSNVEKAFVKNMMKANPDMTEKAAHALARQKYMSFSNEMAINKVLGFIDNPHVRSNIAFSARNIARYYRANEDFYRRAARALSPITFMRLRLANNALEHAGFIHEDENGDKYFSIPADEIIYNAYALTIGRLVGVENIHRPMPLSLTGKIKMLTPSLDPESNLPTFSSPFMSLGWGALMKVVPEELIPNSIRNPVTKGLFGQYSTNSSIWQQVMPSAIKRVMTGLDIMGAGEEQVASATMQAGRIYSATGRAPGENATQDQINQFNYDVKVTARNIVFVRNLLGLISPVSPQLTENKDIPKYLLDAGVVPLKREFTKLVTKETDAGNVNAWNDAIVKFTKVNPGMLVYTVPESKANSIAPIRYTKQGVDWVQNNAGLVKRYGTSSLFFMPQVNKFDMESYSFLKREGFIKAQDVDAYLSDLRNVVVKNEYYQIRNDYQKRIAAAGNYDEAQRLTSEMQWAQDKYRREHPSIKGIMENQTGHTQEKRDLVLSMKSLLASGELPPSPATIAIRKMIDVFDNFDASTSLVTASTDYAALSKERMRSRATDALTRLANSNVNAKLFYDTVLKSLIG